MLKAADLCGADPEGSARRLVQSNFAHSYEYARQAMTEIPFASWREFDAEDSLRFFALRLHDIGMIETSQTRSSPRAPTGAS